MTEREANMLKLAGTALLFGGFCKLIYNSYHQNNKKIPIPKKSSFNDINNGNYVDTVGIHGQKRDKNGNTGFLPDKYEPDVIYHNNRIYLSDGYARPEDAKKAITWFINNIVIPYYGSKPITTLTIGRSGNPEQRKEDYPPNTIMIPIYASRFRQEIKDFETYFIDNFKLYCSKHKHCVILNKDGKNRGNKMNPRNGDWFFLYVVVHY